MDQSLPTAKASSLWKGGGGKGPEDTDATPCLVLRLEEGSGASSSVALAGIVAGPDQTILHVETNAPLPRKPHSRSHAVKGTLFQKVPNQSASVEDLEESDDKDIKADTTERPASMVEPVQTWIRKELAQASHSLPTNVPQLNESLRVKQLEAKAAEAEQSKARLEQELQRLQTQLNQSKVRSASPDITPAPLPEDQQPPQTSSRLCNLM